MAWTPWRTWVAANVLTAAQLNTDIRDNLNAQFPLGDVPWVSWTPTLVQSAAVAKTVNYAKYMQIGKAVWFNLTLTTTAVGTANAAILIGLPVTAATTNSGDIGVGGLRRPTTDQVPGIAALSSTTTLGLRDTTVVTTDVLLGQTGSAYTGALTSGHVIYACGHYEAA